MAKENKALFRLKSIKILGIFLLSLVVVSGFVWIYCVIFYFPFYTESYSRDLLYYKDIACKEFQQNPNTLVTGEDIIVKFKRSKSPIFGTKKKLSVIFKKNSNPPIFWVKIPYYLTLKFKNNYVVICPKPSNTKAIREISETEFYEQIK